MTIPDKTYFEHPIINPRYLNKNYPKFFEFLNKKYPELKNISEKLYWYTWNLTKHPKCPVCDKPVKFINFSSGYQKYCSKKCSNSSLDKQNKTKQTCLKKYGVENPRQSQLIKNKATQTYLKKYGVENPSQNNKIKEKIKQSNINKYGVEYIGQVDVIKDKIKQTCLEKYGVSAGCLLDKAVINREKTRKKKQIQKYNEIIDIKNEFYICKCPHPECNRCKEKQYAIEYYHFFDRKRDKTEPCTKLLPVGEDRSKNTSIEIFIKNILDKYNINYETNVRNVIPPKELDIYIPSKKIAIECNGVYWHSLKTNNYHINKTKMCNERDIQLLHIWEDWIIDPNKSLIIESILKNKIGVERDTTIIYARKCIIEQCTDKKEYLKFLDDNHIQGRSGFKIGYGLRYNGELVSVMTFCTKRGCMGNKNINNNEWELSRFCNKLNYRIPGGASKLLNHFIKDNNPTTIYSFSSNDISNGNLYKQLGFVTDNKINSSYWYVDKKTFKRYHRTSFTKDSIIKKGFIKNLDKSTWTEKEVMNANNFICIYDSGQLKWILNLT